MKREEGDLLLNWLITATAILAVLALIAVFSRRLSGVLFIVAVAAVVVVAEFIRHKLTRGQ